VTQDADATGALLYLNANRTGNSNTLLFEQSAGGTDILSLQDDGDLAILGDITITGGDIIGAATTNLLNAATTVNLGSTAVARAINIGTGTDVDTISIGTGATGADVISIGQAAASLALTDAQWSISSAGVFSVAPTSTGTYLDYSLETEWTAGDLINANFTSATTQTGIIRGINLDFTNLTPDGTNAITGIKLSNPELNNGSIISGVYITGTNWDQGIYSEDDIKLTDNAYLNLGTSSDITFVHNGTNSILTSNTGDLNIDNTNTTGTTAFILGTDTTATDFQIQNNSTSALFTVLGSGAATFSGDLTVSGGDITGANSAAIDIGEAVSGNILLYANGDTDDYIHFYTATNEEYILFEDASLAYTNDPGFRLNSTTGNLEYRDDDESTWTSFDSISGASTTLQNAYDNDADGSDATITLSSTDDSLVISNPASSGTDSAFTLHINQQNTTGALSALDITQASNAYDAVNIIANAIDTENVIDISATGLTSGNGINIALTEATLSGGNYIRAYDNTAAAAVFTVGEDGNTTIAGAGGSNIFNITAGDAVLSDGSLTITDADNAATFALTNNTATTVGAGVFTDGLVDISSTSLTTGNLLNLETTTALTSGRVLNASSTSTALTTGSLGYFDWSPGSTTTATGDLFYINIGTNGSTSGSLFNIADTGSSLFKVTESQITSALPHAFTAAGDVSIAYDLNFTNQTSSLISSNAPLTIEAGEPAESNNLTFKTYGSGDFVFDNDGSTIGVVTDTGDVVLGASDATNIGGSGLLAYGAICADDSLDTADDCIDAARSAGTVYGIASSFTVDDIAENFPTADSGMSPADIVSLDYQSIPAGANPEEYETEFVKKATSSDNANLLGIISEKPAVLLGGWKQNRDPRSAKEVAVALSGRVPVKVTSLNGNIQPGDLITAGTIPGVGVKATDRSQSIIGKALDKYENADTSAIGTVLVFVNTQWSQSLADQGSADTTSRVISLENQLALLQTQLDLGTQTSNTAAFTDLTVTNLNVLGDAILGDTVINGKLNVGTIQIDNTQNSIDAIGTLKLQPLALGNIEFLGGLITFDTEGNIIANEITANKYNVAGASAGTNTLSSGQKKVFVNTSAVTGNSLIFVTPKKAISFPLSVTDKVDGQGFRVELPATQSQPLDFDWFIIDKTN